LETQMLIFAKNRNWVKNIKVLTKRKEKIKIEWQISKVLAKRKEKAKFEWQILKVLIHCTWLLKILSLHIATVVKSHTKINFATSNKKCLKNICNFILHCIQTGYVTLPLHFHSSFPENYNVSCLWKCLGFLQQFLIIVQCTWLQNQLPETVIAIF
jgi:hypothetical protein